MSRQSCVRPVAPDDHEGDGRWVSRHSRLLAEAKEKEPDVVFIGDSIIQDLEQRPIWNDLFEPLHSLNFGMFNDGTEHVLYRIQDGILDNIKPKVVVLHVGTSNIHDEPVAIAEAIVKIVEEIQARLPNAVVIVLEILPRGETHNKLRERNDKVNEIVREKLANSPKVEIISSGKTLLSTDGGMSHHDTPDYFTLSDAGFRKVFEPVHELILQLFGENDEKDFERLN